MRSECGARARSRKPLPGGSGPLLDRHDDRSPRSAVDSGQIEAGNARQVGSQETQELELSQRRMRSPWRVPRRSAERRAARDTGRRRAWSACEWRHSLAWCGHGWMRLSALRLPSGRQAFFVRVVVRKARMRGRIARTIFSSFRGGRRPSPESITTNLSEGSAENALRRQRLWIPGSRLRRAPEWRVRLLHWNPVWVPAFAGTSGRPLPVRDTHRSNN